MIGQKFGRLTVIAEAGRYIDPKTRKPRRQWLCRCECGGEAVTSARKLQSAHTKSCGCLQAENRTKHGHQTGGKSPTYVSWDAMMARCYRKSQQNYERYGGRGVIVCDRWHSFPNFLADMGERPAGKTLDRIDSYGNYETVNCRWATPKEQQTNTRRKLAA